MSWTAGVARRRSTTLAPRVPDSGRGPTRSRRRARSTAVVAAAEGERAVGLVGGEAGRDELAGDRSGRKSYAHWPGLAGRGRRQRHGGRSRLSNGGLVVLRNTNPVQRPAAAVQLRAVPGVRSGSTSAAAWPATDQVGAAVDHAARRLVRRCSRCRARSGRGSRRAAPRATTRGSAGCAPARAVRAPAPSARAARGVGADHVGPGGRQKGARRQVEPGCPAVPRRLRQRQLVDELRAWVG